MIEGLLDGDTHMERRRNKEINIEEARPWQEAGLADC